MGLTGCLSPIAMHRAVMEYDHTVSRVEAELLLLNIARAHHHLPFHFTGITNVAATFNFRSDGGIGTQFFSSSNEANLYAFNLGASIAENPTVTIVPIQGEEFTKRILAQMDETKFWFLYRQDLRTDLLLRLMAREVQINKAGAGSRKLLRNFPHHPEEYREFRKRLLHLSALDLQHELYVGPVSFYEQWPLPLDHPLTEKAFAQGYVWAQNESGQPILVREVTGRIVITNYDPAKLTNDQRRELHRQAKQHSHAHILVDIRPGFPGGDYPLQGWIELRSLEEILVFLGRGIEEEAEFDVAPDSRSGLLIPNPAETLAVGKSPQRPQDAVFSVKFRNHWYSVLEAAEQGKQIRIWHLEAFRILSQLYQMTVTDIAKVPTPAITIAK